jgi:two-component system, response regulator
MMHALPEILLVEDNSADEEMVLYSLEESHLANSVKVLRDGEEAIDYIFGLNRYREGGLGGKPCLLLLDLHLPKMDGLEVLRQIRGDERTREIPVFVLTSSMLDRERIEGHRLGVNGYIEKPVGFENLSRAAARIGFRWGMLS